MYSFRYIAGPVRAWCRGIKDNIQFHKLMLIRIHCQKYLGNLQITFSTVRNEKYVSLA